MPRSRRSRLVLGDPDKRTAESVSEKLRLFSAQDLIAAELPLQRGAVEVESALLEQMGNGPPLVPERSFELSGECLHALHVQCTMCIVKHGAHSAGVRRANILKMGASYERLGKPKLPGWWTALAWPRVDADERSQDELARLASEIAGRTKAWGGDAISKMRSGASVTRELANALSDVLEIERPYWEARSPAEARAFRAAADLHDAVSNSTVNKPEVLSRRSRVFGALGNIVADAKDQKAPVESEDEGSPRGLGHRRAPDRRKTTPRSRS